MTIRVGVQIQPAHWEYRAMRDAWVAVEEAGADVLLTWDHFFPFLGDPDGKHFEALSLLAAMAEVTERIEFGALVMCNSYRNPHLLADATRTLDHVSGGRHILGIGAGWYERDYVEFGYEYGTAPDRLRALGAALPVIAERMAKGVPAPTHRIPILIGGGGEQVTLRLAARHADIWHGFGDPDTIRHKCEVLDLWCAKEGRDPSAIERSCSVLDYLDRLDDCVAAGATFLVIGFNGTSYDAGKIAELIAFRDERNRAS